MKKYILSVFICFLSILPLFSQVQLSDSAKISLITTSPWNGAIYAVYGHTALFVQDDSTRVDAVFNYGFFNQDQPNFMYHFVRGETDYVLGVTPFDFFLQEYKEKKLEVIEQELNLTQEEKQNLWNALYENAKPENREYRYSFLFDNCATRPRDMVEKYVQGQIVYPSDNKKQTARDLIHECVNPYPWMEFGIDLIIGSGADSTFSVREKMFLPVYLMRSFDGARVIKNDTLQYNLVKNKIILLNADNKNVAKSEQGLFNPLPVVFALLLLTILVSFVQKAKMNRTALPKIYDTVLFGIAGIGGLIIFFLMFFSEHPVVDANWNFVWLNIFSLVFAILFWVKPLRNIVTVYHFINFAVLTLFLVFWWLIPQKLPFASIPFAACLWIRSGVNVWLPRKRKIHDRKFTSSSYMKAGWGH